MTPLIREMVKYIPEPESAMWFDFGQLGHADAARVSWHWRNCRSGKRVWVRECWKGAASKGTVFKDYRVAA